MSSYEAFSFVLFKRSAEASSVSYQGNTEAFSFVLFKRSAEMPSVSYQGNTEAFSFVLYDGSARAIDAEIGDLCGLSFAMS